MKTMTAEMTPAERTKVIAMWTSPLQQKIAASNPIVAATRAAMERTNWRVGTEIGSGSISVSLTAFEIKNGKPYGTGQSRPLATFAIGQTDKIVAFLNALEAPAS